MYATPINDQNLEGGFSFFCLLNQKIFFNIYLAYKIHMSNDTRDCLVKESSVNQYNITARGTITVKVCIHIWLLILGS